MVNNYQYLLLGFTIILSADLSNGLSLSALKKGQCIYISSAKGYDCRKLDLTAIPETLTSSAEVCSSGHLVAQLLMSMGIIEASLNRIRDLSANSLKNYAYLKELYLNDNMIQTIESDTFDSLEYLHTLDLSVNCLVELPDAVLHLPSLRILSLSRNPLLDTTSLFSKAAPVSAPLQHLDISYTMLSQMPDFGVMMDLVHLNITGSHVKNVSKTHFIGLCNLKLFTNVNLTMDFSTVCDCAQIDRWFNVKAVNTNPPFSPRCEFAADSYNVAECAGSIEPNATDLATHEKCISEYQEREIAKTMLKTVTIVLSTIGGIILFCGVCYLYYRWQSFDDDENKNIKNDLKSEKVNAHLLTKNNEYIN